MSSTQTPAQLGYRMPAEWEPHAATWLSWPRREGISFPDSFDGVLPTLREMVAALIESEPVCINVINGAHEAEARAVLDVLPQECVTYYEIPTNEPWCRDHGPIFLTRNADPKLAIVDWDYNAWGNKYPPFNLDEVVPTRVAEILKVPVFYPRRSPTACELRQLLYRKQLRARSDIRRSRGRNGPLDLARLFSFARSDRNRLSRINLGSRDISLPDPAAAGDLIRFRRGFVAAFQNRVVEVGRVRFARIEFNDDPFALQIDGHILDTADFH